MEQSHDHTDRLWVLVARKLAGEAGPEDLAELEDLLNKHPDESFAIDSLHQLWPVQPTQDPVSAEESYRQLLRRMQQSGIDENVFADETAPMIQQETRRSGKRTFVWIFSLALLLLGAGFLFTRYSSTAGASAQSQAQTGAIREVSTRYGSRSKLVLPDGSKVFLNAGSKLTYDKSFDSQERIVRLSGEAYFDIVKNPSRPFIIQTASMNIRVIGTAFNVKCYPDEDLAEASLVRGSIEVMLHDRSDKIILKPNEKLTLHANRAEVSGKPVKTLSRAEAPPVLSIGRMTQMPSDSSIVETSWIDNKLVFRSERFDDLAVKMERWYGVHIRFADESLREIRFTGIFERENISQALDALKLTANFSYSLDKDQVVIQK